MFHISAAIEVLACTGAGFSTIYLSWLKTRSFRKLSVIPKSDEVELMRLQSQFGYNEHSFIGVALPSESWFDAENMGAVSYAESGNIWVVAGEPLGPVKNIPAITANFLEYARSRKRTVAFLPATERFARSMLNTDVRIVKVGASPYFDLKSWNPRGNCAKHLRLGVNHGRKAGVTVELVVALTPDFRSEVQKLSREWCSSRRSGVTFGWLFELMPFYNSESKQYFAARNASGKLVGVLAASPIPARDGWYLEDVLRSEDAPRGTSDLLVFEALRTLAAQGAAVATLGTVPLSQKGGDEDLSRGDNALVLKMLGVSRRYMNSLYNFDGLGQFKSKFVPTWWESEYVIVSRGHMLPPRVANAIFNIAVPGGLSQVLQILLLGRPAVPPLPKSAERDGNQARAVSVN